MAKENGFGMSDEAIRKLIDREKSRKEKNLRQRIAHKLLVSRARAAGLIPTDAEIDEAIAKMKQ